MLQLLGQMRGQEDCHGDAVTHLETALAQATDPALTTVIRLDLAFALLNAGDIPRAMAVGRAALADAEPLGDAGLVAEALSIVVVGKFITGIGSDHASLQRALALEDRSRSTQLEFRPSAIAAMLAVYYTDTWEWDGTTWTQRSPAFSPPYAWRHSMTYDSVRQRVVMYSGQDQIGNIGRTLYEWDGTTWMPRGTTPDAVNGLPPSIVPSPIVFDRQRNAYVLYRHFDTWELDGAGRWSRKATHPGGITFATAGSMAFDSDRGRALLFGNTLVNPTTSEPTLWEWTGSAWRKKPALLPVVEDVSLTYDSGRRRTVLAGGVSGFSVSTGVFEWRYFADDPTCSLGPP